MCGNKCLCLSVPTIDLRTHGNAIQYPPGLQAEETVNIIYRRNIKVHFSSISEASQANYYEFNKELDLSKGGIVYPFTGIRGDSKELWSKVKMGKLPNVSLARADNPFEQRDIMSRSDIIIIACGYQSTQIPIIDKDYNYIPLSKNASRDISTSSGQ
jgi:hypothetical protein